MRPTTQRSFPSWRGESNHPLAYQGCLARAPTHLVLLPRPLKEGKGTCGPLWACLPPLPRGAAMQGQGKASDRWACVPWHGHEGHRTAHAHFRDTPFPSQTRVKSYEPLAPPPTRQTSLHGLCPPSTPPPSTTIEATARHPPPQRSPLPLEEQPPQRARSLVRTTFSLPPPPNTATAQFPCRTRRRHPRQARHLPRP